MVNIKTNIKSTALVHKKRQLICRGAMEVFKEKGYSATSMRDIAGITGMSLGGLYDYIEKKEDILFMVHNEILEKIDGCMRGLPDSCSDPVEELTYVLRRLLKLNYTFKKEIQFIYSETKCLKKENLHQILKKESKFIAAFKSVIVRGIEKGVFDVACPDIAANMLAYNASVLALRGWAMCPRHSHNQVIEDIVHFLLKSLKVSPLGIVPDQYEVQEKNGKKA